MDVDSFGKGGKRGKKGKKGNGDGNNGKKGGKRQNQSQSVRIPAMTLFVGTMVRKAT